METQKMGAGILASVSVELSENQRSCKQTTVLNPWWGWAVGRGPTGLASQPFYSSTGLQESPSPCVKGPTLWLSCWLSASSK